MNAVPAEYPVAPERVRDALAGAPRLAVLDDDPTGTQTVRGLPVLTAWSDGDVRWALRQDTPGLFILTNSRGMPAGAARATNRAVADACLRAGAAEGVRVTFASRSDSTLRGHFPLEVEALAESLACAGQPVDGVVIVPAYIDAGRVTIDSVHYLNSGGALVPVADSEFARDATFGYTQSHLAQWVAEKSGGAVAAADVDRLTLADLRGGPDAVTGRLRALRGGRMVVVDALTDNDLRVLVMSALDAERAGSRFVYRVGPSLVRARVGQGRHDPVDDGTLSALLRRSGGGAGGLIVVGSHVSLTNRQLARLPERVPAFELPVTPHPSAPPSLVDLAERVAAGLARGDVVLRTARDVVRGDDPPASLALARRVSTELAAVVRAVVARVRPAFVVAKGGITAADIATESLGMRRAWVLGTLLPGLVSLWEPATAHGAIPYVVFAGNVGDDGALATVVERLTAAR